MSFERPVSVLIAALGGQGGGVLIDWLTEAARIDGLAAQATSIAGVAQRTGATTYYFEVYPQRDPSDRPQFSIYPAAGAVDLLLAFEPMEAGRALAAGMVGPETTVITASARIISTAEKVMPGDGTARTGPVLGALGRSARRLRVVDMNEAAAGAGTHPNAVMFGALVASGVLPMRSESCRAAIERAGVAVARNLAGFDAGQAMPDLPVEGDGGPEIVYKPVPDGFAAAVDGLPEPVRRMASHGAAHLLDYQGPAYVGQYLDRLARLVKVDAADQGYRLTGIVAQRLAAWMAFEDVIRVADLKTRLGRLGRIRRELGIADDAPLTVHDFLKPGWEELRGLLPASLGFGLPQEGTRRYGHGFALKLRTTGPLGWAALRLLARLKPWRPRTARYRHEQAMIARWLDSLAAAAASDYELACDTANLAVWARGYGETRRRGLTRLTRLFDDWPQRLAADPAAAGAAVKESLAAAYADPDMEVAR